MDKCAWGSDQRARSAARYPGRINRCTIVVPAYRARETICRTVRALMGTQGVRVDAIFVVCSPGDDGADALAEFDQVRVVKARSRLSAGAARNLGASLAPDADVLIFVDADCAPEADCLARLVSDVVDGRLDVAGAMVANAGTGLTAWLRHSLEFKEADRGRPEVDARFVPSATIACRRSMFEAAGGFPDLWPGEDLVLCHRVGELGGRIGFSAGAITEHLPPGGWRRLMRHQYDLGFTSARARLSTGMPGVVFARFPVLAPLLLLGRAWRGLAWFARYRRTELAEFLAALPLYLAALGVWSAGFVCGSKAGPE